MVDAYWRYSDGGQPPSSSTNSAIGKRPPSDYDGRGPVNPKDALDDECGGWVSRKPIKDFIVSVDAHLKFFGDRVLQ
ncbi:hypothetical protein ACFX2C_028602 [Malus domestica]